MIDVAQELIDNHHLYKRDFLWRHTENPYEIMIAEFMLHRTKAEQVAPIYQDFITKYPDIDALASADIHDVSKVTQHLGLHWRSHHFIEACQFLKKKYKGIFPKTRTELLEIPGVGDYVAGAILTVCFKKKEYVVDSNIARFINRYYGLNLSGEIRRKKIIVENAKVLFDGKHPNLLLFSILDFTALICKPQKPRCQDCHLNETCAYAQESSI